MVKEHLVDFYDNLAKNYLELYGEEQKEKWEEVIRYLVSNLDIKKLICIDLGCGVGIKNLKSLFYKAYGLDISFESLKLAKGKYDYLINVDLEKLCIRSNENILLVSVSVLQNLDETLIHKILRVKVFQIHSVMFRSKGEEFWKDLFFRYKFKYIKKVNNDLIFANF